MCNKVVTVTTASLRPDSLPIMSRETWNVCPTILTIHGTAATSFPSNPFPHWECYHRMMQDIQSDARQMATSSSCSHCTHPQILVCLWYNSADL